MPDTIPVRFENANPIPMPLGNDIGGRGLRLLICDASGVTFCRATENEKGALVAPSNSKLSLVFPFGVQNAKDNDTSAFDVTGFTWRPLSHLFKFGLQPPKTTSR